MKVNNDQRNFVLYELIMIVAGPKENNFLLQWSPRVLQTGIDLLVDITLKLGMLIFDLFVFSFNYFNVADLFDSQCYTVALG